MRIINIIVLLTLPFVCMNAGCEGGGGDAEVDGGFPVIPEDRFDIDEFRGKVTVVDFFGTYCIGCEEEVKDLVKIVEEYGDEDVAIIGVCLDHDASKSVPPYATKHGINYPVYDGSDDALKSEYKIIGIPTTIFFDRDGKEATRKLGAMSQEEIAAEIDKLL
jgi:thiol-disulfide isomerase/thioredoxin